MEDLLLLAIVVYNKKISDLELFKSQNLGLEEKIDIFIYDNSLEAQTIPQIDSYNIIYVHDPKNSGVSKAYNEGYQKAKELNKPLLLVVDQDTEFKAGYLDKYLDLYKNYGDDYIYAPIVCDHTQQKIFSPAFLNNYVGKTQDFKSFNIGQTIYNLEGKSLINSGLMIPLKIFEKIGLYNEEIKLDFSDVYFIEKYKHYNKNIILVVLYLLHNLSGNEKNYEMEYNRFSYYCHGAKVLADELNTSLLWSVSRRLARLVLKYKSISFVKVYLNCYLRGEKC